MRFQPVLGVLLVIVGLVLLYVLRHVFFELIVLVLEFIGVVVALVLIVVGVAMAFWPRRGWRGLPV
jgi:hypothetical protein